MLRPWAGIFSRHPDLLIVAGLTILAAALRLWALGDIPQGIHGDEAQVGMDARRVLAHGWIGPYTPAALGQPSGHAYLTAPAIELFGSTDWSVRLPLALMGVAAVPLAYALFRLQSTRAVATIAAFLLAISLWHIHFSRVAHWPISYVTIALAVLVLWTLALQRGRWFWFVAAGAVLGLGLYTYNIYPIFVIAFTLWVAVYTLLFKRHDLLAWARNVGLAVAAAVIVGLPLLLYIANPKNDYFGHYRGYYEQYSVLQSKAYKQAGTDDRIEIVVRQAKRFIGAYAWRGVTDFVDGASPDRKPMLDKLTVGLFVAGAALGVWRWRETPHLMSLMLVAIIPLTTVLQTNAVYRGPLGVVPFIAFLAALPLGLAWQTARQLRLSYRPFVYSGIIAALAIIAYTNVRTYFDDWAGSSVFPWVYAQQISEASKYAAAQPDKPYVYFFSARWTWNYETRQYLAPDVKGEDRSKEFGRQQGLDIDRSRDSLILLLPPYLSQIEEVERLYPGGEAIVKRDGDETLFIAYHVPQRTPGLLGSSE